MADKEPPKWSRDDATFFATIHGITIGVPATLFFTTGTGWWALVAIAVWLVGYSVTSRRSAQADLAERLAQQQANPKPLTGNDTQP